MSAAAPFLRAFLLAVISLLTGPFRLHAAGIDPYKLEEIQTLIAGSQFDEADRLMRAALIDAPNDVDLICLRGTVAVMRDELPQAEALFREGRKLLDEGQLDAACSKLAESQRLDASPGTLGSLAQ